MQDDLLFPMLTVEETLMFAAELRLPRTVSKSKKRRRVQDLIDQLDLQNAKNTVIGDEGHRGISGGERRRVSIGIDIIHDPILLFLDEPTSGLDSSSAFMVVKVLQRIAQTGSIVIMSIHQPSYRILCLINRLIFLSRGEIVYNGTPSNLSMYLADLGHPIPQDENPSEAALDLIRDLENGPDGNGTKNMVEFNKTWKNMKTSSCSASADREAFSPLKEAVNFCNSRGKLLVHGGNYTNIKAQIFANPFWVEVLVLSKRSFLNSRRMPELFAARFLATFVTAIILATLFLRVDISPVGNGERIRFVGFAIATVFFVCTDGIPSFLEERNIFLRETAFNTYRKYSYCISHALVWIPPLLVLSITLSTITFWGSNINGGFWELFFYFGIIMASFWTGNSFVTMVTEIVPQVILGYVLVVATLSYYLLFCGLFISRDRIPTYWLWFHYLSPKKYANAAILSKWDCFWITIAWGFFFRMLFYFALLIGSKNKRK